METKKVREYIIVKNKFNHPALEEVGCHNWVGDLACVSEVYRMLKEVFKMHRLSSETSYVVSLDHAKKLKGVCRVGLGDASETLLPIQSIFTFLLLTGAHSFYVVHNHVSEIHCASPNDKNLSIKIGMFSGMFDNMDFIGHMIISPKGYLVDGGSMDGINEEFPYEDLGDGMAAYEVDGKQIIAPIDMVIEMFDYLDDDDDDDDEEDW